jgi:hypothetical protein
MAKPSVELHKDETVIRDGWANHFVGSLSDTGHLFLTNRRLIFHAHRMNLFGVNGALPVGDVREMIPGRVPTELTLVLADGSRHRFAVWHRKTWMRDIEAARSAAA